MSPLAEPLRGSWSLRVAALLIGGAAVLHDLYGPWAGHEYRLAAGALVLALFLALMRGDTAAAGIAMPVPSVRWWLRATAIWGSVFCVVVVAIAAVLYAVGDLPLLVPIEDPARELWIACVVAPFTEEPIYRLALCVPLVAIIGYWPTIIVSGAVFALVHHRFGVLAPDNALAGLLLGWAYLRSGSLALPILLHALGNGLVLLVTCFVLPQLL